MADNIAVTPGSGASVAADDVGGVLHQRVKITLGGDGTSEGDVAKSNPLPARVDDVSVAMQRLLAIVANPTCMDAASGRLRVMLDSVGGSQTLGTVTTVSTVTTVTTVTTVATLTNMAQVGGIPANSFVLDQMHSAWAQTVRSRIS